MRALTAASTAFLSSVSNHKACHTWISPLRSCLPVNYPKSSLLACVAHTLHGAYGLPVANSLGCPGLIPISPHLLLLTAAVGSCHFSDQHVSCDFPTQVCSTLPPTILHLFPLKIFYPTPPRATSLTMIVDRSRVVCVLLFARTRFFWASRH